MAKQKIYTAYFRSFLLFEREIDNPNKAGGGKKGG